LITIAYYLPELRSFMSFDKLPSVLEISTKIIDLNLGQVDNFWSKIPIWKKVDRSFFPYFFPLLGLLLSSNSLKIF